MDSTPRQPAPLQRLDGTAVRVLVVDDEPNISELLSMALRYEGWDVRAQQGPDRRPSARPRRSVRTRSCST